MSAVVASGTTQNTGNNLTLARPNGAAVGDLLVAFVASDGTGVTLGAPGGWVLIGGKNDVQRSMRAWYRYVTNSEPTTYTFTSSSGNTVRASMVRITGAPSSDPIDLVGGWQAGTGNTLSVSAMSPAQSSGQLQLAFLTTNAAANYTMATPSGWSALAQNGEDNKAHMAWRTVSGSAPAATFTGTNLYGWGTGTLLVASGSTLVLARVVSVTHELVRAVVKPGLGGSIAVVGTSVLQRVVLRLFEAVIGGASTTTDAIVDNFPDTFLTSAGQTGPPLSADLIKLPLKVFPRVIPTFGGYAKVTQKLLESSITVTGLSRRVIIRIFRASIAPSATFNNANIGRLFGAPGIVDITARLAGEIRARVRRR